MEIKKIFIPTIKKTAKNVAKLKWHKFGKTDSRKFFAPINIENKDLGNLKVSFEKPNNSENKSYIKIINNAKEVIGREILSLYKDMKYMYGFNISVLPKYRNTGANSKHRLGELLRLSSIITMLKNKYKSIKIYSINEAVYFHSKYKFEPNIEDINEAKLVLKSISEDLSPQFSDIAKNAKKLLLKKPNKKNLKSKIDYLNKVNDLVNIYIKKVLLLTKNGEGHDFAKGFDMILTEETIKKHAKFFNNLFKKHGINYQI